MRSSVSDDDLGYSIENSRESAPGLSVTRARPHVRAGACAETGGARTVMIHFHLAQLHTGERIESSVDCLRDYSKLIAVKYVGQLNRKKLKIASLKCWLNVSNEYAILCIHFQSEWYRDKCRQDKLTQRYE